MDYGIPKKHEEDVKLTQKKKTRKEIRKIV